MQCDGVGKKEMFVKEWLSVKVKYIGKADIVALEKGKVYHVMAVEKGWYRIMTELEEDYLFPPNQCEIVEI